MYENGNIWCGKHIASRVLIFDSCYYRNVVPKQQNFLFKSVYDIDIDT